MTPADIAQGFIGYTEGKNNDTIFGKWFGMNNNPYCMMFVQYCYDKAGNPLHYKTASCSAFLRWYTKNKPHCIVAKPRRSDIVIFDFGHTGLVIDDLGDKITTIEANTSPNDQGSQNNGQGVYKRTRKKSTVTAFIRPYEELEDTMTGEELYNALNDYLKKQTVSGYAKNACKKAVSVGAFSDSDGDGSVDAPKTFLTREQFASVLDRLGLLK